jgi:hypothetical protein
VAVRLLDAIDVRPIQRDRERDRNCRPEGHTPNLRIRFEGRGSRWSKCWILDLAPLHPCTLSPFHSFTLSP